MIQRYTHPRILFFLIIGIITGYESTWMMPMFWIAACVALWIASVVLRRKPLMHSICTATTVMALGGMAVSLKRQGQNPILPENRVNYTATVISPPARTEKSYAVDLWMTESGEEYKIKAYFQLCDSAAALCVGQCITAGSKLQAPKDFLLSPNFNYKDYLIRQGFCATTYIPKTQWRTAAKGRLADEPLLITLRIKALQFRQTLLDTFRGGM